LEAFRLLAIPPKQQKQEEEKNEQEKENTTPAVAVVAQARSGAKLFLQAGELIGYTLLGTTGFFWLFWFNSPYFEYIEIPVIAGIILIAASFIYDTKSKRKEKRKWALKIRKSPS
jgi:hypothetical protein